MNFNFDKNSLILSENIVKSVEKLSVYEALISNIANSKKYNFPESFVRLPFDETTLIRVLKLKQKVMNPNIKYVVVIGIGGSNLGAKAVYDAIYGYADILEPNRFPKLIFLETLQPNFAKKVLNLVQKNEALIILISKSGSTTESLANFNLLKNNSKSFNKENVVVISNEMSNLLETSKKQGFHTLSIPRLVGGRYSVLSTVGLFPLACANIDIVELCQGAILAQANIKAAQISSSLITTHYRNGKDVLVNFFFDSRLETLGKWQKQLVAESLGKKDNCENPQGITCEISIGTTDMHSVLQLYLSGKNDRFYNFVKVNNSTQNVVHKNGTTDMQILNDIYNNTKKAFSLRQLPFMETEFKNVSEKELGYYMQFKMLETAFVARLLQVNAFDQPDVEAYKKGAL